MIHDYTTEETKALSADASKQEFRQKLEDKYGADNVFDTEQVVAKFEIIGFGAPFVSVIRRIDRVAGTLEFSHSPRFYFDFRSA